MEQIIDRYWVQDINCFGPICVRVCVCVRVSVFVLGGVCVQVCEGRETQ